LEQPRVEKKRGKKKERKKRKFTFRSISPAAYWCEILSSLAFLKRKGGKRGKEKEKEKERGKKEIPALYPKRLVSEEHLFAALRRKERN